MQKSTINRYRIAINGMLLLGVMISLSAMSVANADNRGHHYGGNHNSGDRKKLLVCHYDKSGELKAKLLPARAARKHYKKHFPNERPYLWSDGSYRCEDEPPTICSSGNRYEDLKDGTVLDCNTDLVWLKAASCLGTGNWNFFGVAGDGSAQGIVASLNTGDDFSCADYTAGMYTNWRLPEIDEFCSADTGGLVSLPCPDTTASNSLIDSSIAFPGPTVQNTEGVGPWMEMDPFIGVESGIYWSATESDALTSWRADLSNGLVDLGFQDNSYFVWPVRDR